MKHNSTPYIKMHGTGNLILIVDQRCDNPPPPGREKLRELGNEATGPGFDQMMWLIGGWTTAQAWHTALYCVPTLRTCVADRLLMADDGTGWRDGFCDWTSGTSADG